jgi:phosphoglycolate phosphatase-like HAD superfamily hydrolase
MSKIKAIIFDVDGVLIDSREANIKLFKSLMKKAGYKEPSEKEILQCFHLSLWHTIEKLTGSKDPEEIRRIWDIAIDTTANTTHLFKFPKNLKKTLGELHPKYRLAVVTSRIKTGLENVFNGLGVWHLFDTWVTYEDCKNAKPHPEPLLLAAKRLGIRPSQAIYVGDSLTDLEASRAAGMKSVHLSDFHSNDADDRITAFDELPAAVGRLARA